MEYILNAKNLYLSIKPEVFEKNIHFPINTSLEVTVQSDGFSANASMDIDAKEFAKFALDLTYIYDTLSGEARIKEPYGNMYLSFIGNGKGHITIKGYLHQVNSMGNEQLLEFENNLDQTYLKKFSYDLFHALKKYMS